MYGTDYDEATGYEEFRIELLSDTSQKSFKLRASSANGEAVDFDYYPPVTGGEVEEAFAGVARANAQFALSVQRSTSDEIRALGERLYNSVWQNRVTELYQQASSMARENGKNLRLRFVFDNSELGALPWEFLFDPMRKDFLTLSTRTPVARQWLWPTPLPERPDFVEPPLRVLVVEAEVRPWDTGVQEEIHNLKNLDERQSRVFELVDIVRNATPNSFLAALSQQPCHVLHLCLSGAPPDAIPGRGTGTGNLGSMPLDSLVLMDDKTGGSRTPQRVNIQTLLDVIARQSELQLIYLSGDCTDWLASQLTQVSPATVGWRGLNTPEAYLSFTKGFYSALVKGLPLESAVTHGRKAIDADYPGGKEWGMPVFYMQTPNGIAMRQPKRDQPEIGSVQATVLSDEAPMLSEGPSDPADRREWTKLRVLLSVAEENYRVLLNEVSKYVDDAVPEYVNSQVKELQDAISSLSADLERLAK